MANKWSRELVLREILACEEAGRPLRVGGDDGVSQALYQAGTRIFGSWSNALRAAGIAASRATAHERWPPGRILSTIRGLARRGRALRVGELRQRYGDCLVPAARRCFGSWRKAVIAAGVDPQRLQRAPAWTKDRVLEAILTRALNNAPLGSRTVQPRTLADAGAKLFGTWAGAIQAAGLNPEETRRAFVQRPDPGIMPSGVPSVLGPEAMLNRKLQPPKWSPEMVLSAIQERAARGEGTTASVVYREHRALLSAAARRFGNWSKALAAAGLAPTRPALATSESSLLNLTSGGTGLTDASRLRLNGPT